MDKNLFQVNISAVILNSDNKVLVIKRSMDEDVYPGLWGIPGGKLDNTDASIEEALVREVEEETGVTIKFKDYIQSNTLVREDLNKIYLNVVGEYLSGDPQPLEDTEEIKWVSKEELHNYKYTPRTLELLEKVLN